MVEFDVDACGFPCQNVRSLLELVMLDLDALKTHLDNLKVSTAWVKKYAQHNTDIIAHFKDRPNDLLVLDLTKGDTWQPLCDFLEVSIPNLPFPKENVTSWKKKLRVKILKFKNQSGKI